MKISEIIRTLEGFQKEFGDVEVVKECDDGVSTFAYEVNPKIAFRQIWKGNPPRPKYFIDL